MKTRFLLLLVVSAAVLACGCESYRYVFDTIISDDGRVERTVHFWSVEREVRKAPAEGETAEVQSVNPGLPVTLVIPDHQRFDEFELTDTEFRGRWHSDGQIYSDFRDMTSSCVEGVGPEDKPKMPPFIREAHNRGEVTVTDLVLVKAIAYTETFHDYYTREELKEHGDAIIDILAGLFLDVLHEDFGDDYDFREFDALMLDKVVPIAKKWNHDFCKESLRESSEIEIDVRSLLMPSVLLGLAYDLARLGSMDGFDPHPDKTMENMLRWGIARMHELVKRKGDGALLPKDTIEAYFGQTEGEHGEFRLEDSPFGKSAAALVAKRYGNGKYFGALCSRIFDSFAFTADSHDFELTVWVPGPVVRALPRTASVEPQEDGTVVFKWAFDKGAFFPDSVELSLMCGVPVHEAQVRLFGEVALDKQEEVRRFVSLLLRLPDEERDAVLECLRGCVEDLSLKGLTDFVAGRSPRGGVSGAKVDFMLDRLVRMLEEMTKPM